MPNQKPWARRGRENFSQTQRPRNNRSRGGRVDRHHWVRPERNFCNVDESGTENEEVASGSAYPDSDRPPPHLRGRDIGMWYAARNASRTPEQRALAREQKLQKQGKRPLATVALSESKKRHILELLTNTSKGNQTVSSASSNFLKDFHRNIQGSIDDKLRTTKTLEQNITLDTKLQKEQEDKKCNNDTYINMMSYREKLPAYNKRLEIVKLVQDNQVIVISGETGCGKTTQVTQFILDDYIERGAGSLCSIVCSQPRRISAISVAERVAAERGESLGHSCGYQIRLERSLPRSRGSIVYCTTGVILRQMAADPLMSNVSHLILDEIHERDIMSDFLIALMRKVLPQRPDMKLILMSATLNSEQFSKYYGNCPMVNIPGFTYPVQEFYLEDVLQATSFQFEDNAHKSGNRYMPKKLKWEREFSEMIEPHIRQLQAEKKYNPQVLSQLANPDSENLNLELILELLKYICRTADGKGAILVFLTGFLEISNLIQLMENSGSFPSSNFIIIPLHSQMPSAEQKHIFQPASGDMRKIIVSTNIAETSITIDDVVYVVDSGYIKESGYTAATNLQTLGATFVSLANAHQRRGRAGRVQPGVCYHLFSKAREMLLNRFQLPEILRTRLENVILHAKALQLGKAHAFLSTLIDVPDIKSIDISLKLLTRIEAIDQNENLTPLGFHLSKLPMAPQMGKMILFGVIFSCLDPILSISATLDFKDAFQLPIGKEREADKQKFQLSNGIKSDHILSHIVLAEYENTYNKYAFCREYFLSQQTIKMLLRMKTQFMEVLHDMNFVPDRDSKNSMCNLNSHNLSLIKAVVCAGLFPNMAMVSCKSGKFVKIHGEECGRNIRFHRKSILCNYKSFESPLITYHTRIKSTDDYIHDATLVHPLAVIFFGDRYRHVMPLQEGLPHVIGISMRMIFKCSESTANVIKQLRERLNAYLQRAILEPTAEPFFKREENDVISAIIELITNEDIEEIDLDALDDE